MLDNQDTSKSWMLRYSQHTGYTDMPCHTAEVGMQAQYLIDRYIYIHIDYTVFLIGVIRHIPESSHEH
jgi:hypothetical protein